MKDYPIKIWPKNRWIEGLHHIKPKPNRLYIRGSVPDPNLRYLTVIGSRKHSEYGEKVLEHLISGLKNYPICIVSGLAFGIDALAHEHAIKNNLKTVAFPGSGLDESVLYPKANYNLAMEILKDGGSVISEFEPTQNTRSFFFPQRNRLMAGISDAILIIEAGEKSGTMITARLALDFGKNVMCVPGSIFNSNAEGVNYLIKEGASPVSSAQDILEILNLDAGKLNKENILQNLSEKEHQVLDLISSGNNVDQIISKTSIGISEINQILTKLELDGLV